MNSSIVKMAIAGAALWAAHKFGPGFVKVAAAGVAGVLVVNQIPVVRDAMNVRLLPDSTAV